MSLTVREKKESIKKGGNQRGRFADSGGKGEADTRKS